MAVLSDTIMNNLRVTHELFLGNPISVQNGGTGTDISDLLDDTLLQYSSSSQKVLSVTSNYLYVSDSLYTDYATKAVKLGGAYFSNESSYSSNFTLLGFGKPVSGSDQIYLYPLDQSKPPM